MFEKVDKKSKRYKWIWVLLTPPFLRRRCFVTFPLLNPLVQSSTCVPPYGGEDFMRIPRQNPMGGYRHPGPLMMKSGSPSLLQDLSGSYTVTTISEPAASRDCIALPMYRLSGIDGTGQKH